MPRSDYVGPDEVRAIFEESVRPALFGASRHSAFGAPNALFVGGQPGSGKTGANATTCSLLGVDAVTIDSDDFRGHHPLYGRIAVETPEHVAVRTQQLAGELASMAMNYALDNRIPFVSENTWKGAQPALRQAKAAKEAGFAVTLSALAVPAAVSRVSMLARYHSELASTGIGRWVPPASHGAALSNFPATMSALANKVKGAHKVTVGRNGEVLYDGFDKGDWKEARDARIAFVTEADAASIAAARATIGGSASLASEARRTESGLYLAMSSRPEPIPLAELPDAAVPSSRGDLHVAGARLISCGTGSGIVLCGEREVAFLRCTGWCASLDSSKPLAVGLGSVEDAASIGGELLREKADPSSRFGVELNGDSDRLTLFPSSTVTAEGSDAPRSHVLISRLVEVGDFMTGAELFSFIDYVSYIDGTLEGEVVAQNWI